MESLAAIRKAEHIRSTYLVQVIWNTLEPPSRAMIVELARKKTAGLLVSVLDQSQRERS